MSPNNYSKGNCVSPSACPYSYALLSSSISISPILSQPNSSNLVRMNLIATLLNKQFHGQALLESVGKMKWQK